MRLLITTDTVGGVWTFTSALTEELLRRGHTVHLVSFGRMPCPDQQAWASHQTAKAHPPSSTPCHLDRSAQRGAERPLYSAGSLDNDARQPSNFTYTPTEIPLEWMQNNEQAFEAGQTVLLKEFQEHRPDLILSNQFCFGRLDTHVPRVVVAHSDVLSWAKACRPSPLEPSPWLNRYTSMVQAGLLDASAVITPTSFMGKALSANFFLPHHYLVIPNGISIAPATLTPVRRKLQAITAGRLWDEAKGLDTLKDLKSPIPLLIAGDNSFESAEQQTSWPAHLQNLGPLSQPELHEHFRHSAVYLCTSRYEPFGLAPLEAALCGCAVVARDLPSLREVWADSALYFTDSASLNNTLQALANDPNLLAQAQDRAHQRALLYTPERMTHSYLHLFETVLQSSRAMPHVA